MRILIVEDDFGGRRYLQALLRETGDVDVVVDGEEAVEAFRLAWEEHKPYNLILLDIMMPNKDGHSALREIREVEEAMGVHYRDHVRVIMTSALDDPRNVVEAYYTGEADAYLVKPIDRETLLKALKNVGIVL